MFQKSFLLVCISGCLFAQSSLVVPYISLDHTGMQVSPAIGGFKSTTASQETELNMVLYHHDSLLIKENVVVGKIEGRLNSELPLSSFDLLKQIENDKSFSVSNYVEKNNVFLESLQKFQEFQDSYEYYDETYIEDDSESYNEELSENVQGSLGKIQQFFVAQEIEYLKSPTINEKVPSLTSKELEQLIQIERLKKQYQQVVSQYNQLVEQQEVDEKNRVFDPADPTEKFTVAFIGDNTSGVWSKSFTLNGSTNYQSYNHHHWYLGYNVPITKKDLRSLYALFVKNKKVRYIVKGSGGSAEFELSDYFISSVKELFQIYGQGKLKKDIETELPLLRQ